MPSNKGYDNHVIHIIITLHASNHNCIENYVRSLFSLFVTEFAHTYIVKEASLLISVNLKASR